MAAKALTGIVTFEHHAPFFPKVLQALHEQTVQYDILVVDNSEDETYAAQLRAQGLEVLRDPPKDKDRIQRIVSGRELLRKECLQRGYTHLWFVDSDVVVPEDALEKLLAANKPIVSGVVLSRMKIQGRFGVFPALYAKTARPGATRLMTLPEMQGEEVIEIDASGLACCLIHRDVLEKVQIHHYEQSRAGEDIALHVDAHKAGFPSFAHLGVKCKHLMKSGVLEVSVK